MVAKVLPEQLLGRKLVWLLRIMKCYNCYETLTTYDETTLQLQISKPNRFINKLLWMAQLVPTNHHMYNYNWILYHVVFTWFSATVPIYRPIVAWKKYTAIIQAVSLLDTISINIDIYCDNNLVRLLFKTQCLTKEIQYLHIKIINIF